MAEPAESNHFWTNLSTREQRLLLGMLCLFAFFGVVLSVYSFQTSLDKTQAEIDKYEEALKTMAQLGPKYLEDKALKASGGGANKSKFTPEVMLKNNVKLTSFVAEHASAVDLKVDNYDEDSIPLSSGKDGPIINENILRFNLRRADLKKLLALLDRIDKSAEPVVIKKIDLREIRKKKGLVRANISVSTFVQKKQEG